MDVMFTIRPVIEQDLPAILEIFNDAILNTTASYDYESHTLEMRLAWFQAKQAAGFSVFVAQEQDSIVGFSTIGPFRARTGYRYTVENTIYVAANRRGQGFGKLLLEPLIEAAESMGVRAIIAVVDAEKNMQAAGFTSHLALRRLPT